MANKPTVPELDKALQDLVKWDRFATHLPGIQQRNIQIIKANNPNDVTGQKLALFDEWLRIHLTASWEDVATTLEIVDENVMARNIRSQYIQEASNTDTSSRTTPFTSLSPPKNPMKPLIDCITQVLRNNFAVLRNTTDSVLPDLAAKLLSAGIIPDGVHRNPTYDKISTSFIQGLEYHTTEKQVAEHCQKYFSAFYSLGGPLKLAADKIKRDITETVKTNLNGKEFIIPQY